jgi:Asp/Glu/hydantoin racemase
MTATLAMIHTVASLAASFGALAREVLPEVAVFHVVDEGLLGRIIAEGHITPAMCLRVAQLASNAQEDGADAILLTCSAMSPAVDLAAPLLRVPIYKVDQAMVEAALEAGARVGVFSTVAATLQSVGALVRQTAERLGRPATVVTELLPEAMAAARGGRREEHDALVRAAVAALAGRSDVVLVAQASAAQALRPEEVRALPAPVLTGPRLALERLRRDWLDDAAAT